ncbi:MAG: hypothetical protein J3K34DRAFT_256739 [Monoraphidium minutum]|nr:MAG: hypothetical protein J3K34DRAFT_256739 [Monoraphidium minutum]
MAARASPTAPAAGRKQHPQRAPVRARRRARCPSLAGSSPRADLWPAPSARCLAPRGAQAPQARAASQPVEAVDGAAASPAHALPPAGAPTPAAAQRREQRAIVAALQRAWGGGGGGGGSAPSAAGGARLRWALSRAAARRWPSALVVASVGPSLLLALTAAGAPVGAFPGCLCDAFSFSVLLGVFTDSEPGAAVACGVAAAGALATLWAVAASGACPAATACLPPAALVVSASLLLSSARACGLLVGGGWRRGLWKGWAAALGVVGGGLLMQMIWSTGLLPFLSAVVPCAHAAGAAPAPGGCGGSALSLLPAAAGAAFMALYWRAAVSNGGGGSGGGGDEGSDDGASESGGGSGLPAWASRLWPDVTAWTATLLLIWQPLLQLLDAAWHPAAAAAAAAASPPAGAVAPLAVPTLLILLANGLMVPRALQAGELMWFTGTASATLLTAANAALLPLAAAAAAGAGAAAALGLPHPARLLTVPAAAVLLAATLRLLRAGWRITQQPPPRLPLVARALGLRGATAAQ